MKKGLVIAGMIAALLLLAGCGSTGNATDNSSAESKKTEEVVFYVTRHGKTMFNAAKRAQGWSDSPLIDEGIEVAEELGKGLKKEKVEFVSAYSSDAGRARETSEVILSNSGQKDLKYSEDKRLREICFGSFEGDLNDNMWEAAAKAANYKDAEAFLADEALSLDGMYDAVKSADKTGMAEALPTVKKRMAAAITDIAKKTEKDGGGNVLIVSHGGAIMALVSELKGEKTAEYIPIENASVTKIVYKDGTFDIKDVGSMDYLEASDKE